MPDDAVTRPAGPKADLPGKLELLRSASDARALADVIADIGRTGEREAIAALEPYLAHQDHLVVASTLQAVSDLGGTVPEGTLLALLERDDDALRAGAVVALARGHPELARGGVERVIKAIKVARCGATSARFCAEQLCASPIYPRILRSLIDETDPVTFLADLKWIEDHAPSPMAMGDLENLIRRRPADTAALRAAIHSMEVRFRRPSPGPTTRLSGKIPLPAVGPSAARGLLGATEGTGDRTLFWLGGLALVLLVGVGILALNLDHLLQWMLLRD